MGKEEFFSKFNIKDYNNQLEKILEKKSFSEGAKNILLNILYKMEISYDDYNKVKVETKLKKEILEDILNIVQSDCEQIELVKPMLNKKTKLGKKSFTSQKNEKKITAYPNEKAVLYGLYNLQQNIFIIDDKYDIIKTPMEKLLNDGYIMDQEEIIRDFDGWSWNIVTEEIENHIYNTVYQNIKILIGDRLICKCVNNCELFDFIKEFESKLHIVCQNELAEEIIKLIYQISILENIKNDELQQKEIQIKANEFTKELIKMENKKEYLQNLANLKKTIGRDIKQIDEIINNNKLLRQKFIEENKKLKETEKVFSLSEYSETLQTKRVKLLSQLKQYGMLMKPMNYIKVKTELKDKVDLLNKIDFNKNYERQIKDLFVRLQSNFLEAFTRKIKNAQSKKEVQEYIYLFRYYKLLSINKDNQIKDIQELGNELIKTEKYLITRACNLKAINILSHNIENNYNIISKILNLNIIDLEEMTLEIKRQEDKIIINIYDDNTIEKTIEYEDKEKLIIKFNKKVKLFN